MGRPQRLPIVYYRFTTVRQRSNNSSRASAYSSDGAADFRSIPVRCPDLSISRCNGDKLHQFERNFIFAARRRLGAGLEFLLAFFTPLRIGYYLIHACQRHAAL